MVYKHKALSSNSTTTNKNWKLSKDYVHVHHKKLYKTYFMYLFIYFCSAEDQTQDLTCAR
jgi:hypothetical protein